MRISEYEQKLAELRQQNGDLEVVRLVAEYNEPSYARVENACTPFLLHDVPQNDEFTIGDLLHGNNFVVVST